jgi:hypothetical protein
MAISSGMLEQNQRILRWAIMVLLSAASPSIAGDKTSTAAELAASLSKSIEDGQSSAKLRLTIKPKAGKEKTSLQVQIKARRSAAKTEVVYQVLWPNDHKEKAFVLRKQRGRAPEGSVLRLPDTISPLKRANMKDSVFGSDLAYEDVVENFFRWEKQSLAGNEKIRRVKCIILESKPGANNPTHYGSVRSWIDPRKLVPMRVMKYDRSGKLAVTIVTDDVSKNDRTVNVPSELTVSREGSGTVTTVQGTGIRHDVRYSNKDFTPAGLTNLKLSR